MRHTVKTCLALLVFGAALAGAEDPQGSEAAGPGDAPTMPRFMIVRTFPPGALAGLDEAAKQEVNRKNALYGARWIRSYANADLTRTFCIYEGPSESAIRAAAEANGIPADAVVEIPVDLMP
ncbi:MAG: DUF4242 domain-containing protein [Candidatus Rokubacteria bacterium]|nr:DUF4242 domain-containing protein [Candidatus Rokubacteria bacterium]